ncbi:MAG: DUF4831 family protein [Paludibacter sp.]|jgi:hypothetical protein|nr:DUF4831 family protein [Paludibacter sp.]
MKYLFSISIFLFAAFGLYSQQSLFIPENSPVLVYSLPKTEVLFDITVEKTEQQPGVYYQYSEKFLATKDVVKESKSIYTITSIVLRTNPVRDNSRTYSLPLTGTSPLNYVAVNSAGLLCGMNVPSIEIQKLIGNTANLSNIKTRGNLIPLTEEYMLAASPAKMAEGAAKQIYRLRESRLNLLSGEVEKMPSDGKSLETMLTTLDNEEQKLTQLFTGSVNTQIQTVTIKYIPTQRVSGKVIFRFSTLKGIVADDDLSGIPYYLSIEPAIIGSEVDPKSKKRETVINTVLPADARVTISDGQTTVIDSEIQLPQLGVLIPITADIYNQTDIKIFVNPFTGQLQKIEKPQTIEKKGK